VIMKKAMPGRWLFSVGTNVRTSKVSGIPGDAVIFFTYVISGFMAGVAAIFITARLESASPTMGEEGVVLNVIGAAVIGGASIYGGIGTSLGAIFGAIIMTLITNGMNMMHISYHSTLIVKGFVIIFFVAFDSLKRATKAVRI
jgi:ribose/xylose/arabinose/galactoside ABC-type transport system permease subunit